jgi:hypothetical protein
MPDLFNAGYPSTPNEARVIFYAFLASDGNDPKLNRLAKAAQKILKQEARSEIAASQPAFLYAPGLGQAVPSTEKQKR